MKKNIINGLVTILTGLFCVVKTLLLVPMARGYVWLSRHIVKRYFGYETWGYRVWWESHSKRIQRQLDKQHQPLNA